VKTIVGDNVGDSVGDSVRGTIKHLQLDQEYYFHEGCHIIEVSNSADDTISIARARAEAGVTTRWHSVQHTTERYALLAGTGRVEIGDGVPTRVAAGDVVIIPAGARQRITNTGDDDLLFLAICSPRFQSDNYLSLEQD